MKLNMRSKFHRTSLQQVKEGLHQTSREGTAMAIVVVVVVFFEGVTITK